MNATKRIDAKAYYNTLPPLTHECGDIWRNLPTFGILGSTLCNGIVITPACDLSWQKSDTLTFLPILPIRTFFSLDAALPTVLEKTQSSMEATGMQGLPEWSHASYVAPSLRELSDTRQMIIAFRDSQQRSAKVNKAIERSISGISILESINSQEITSIQSALLDTLFGSEWPKIKEKIAKNSYSPALHFLPNDNQVELFSGVPAHSVVLFRYPITIPVKILNYAQECTESDWHDKITSASIPKIVADSFSPNLPIKLLSLRSAFLSDLLTRFSALYNRVGSPDFTNETVSTYCIEMDK